MKFYFLDSRFRGNDKKAPSSGGPLGTDGLSHSGKRRFASFG